MIVLCLALLIGQIMSKALKRDIVAFELLKQKQMDKLKLIKKKVAKQIYTQLGQSNTAIEDEIETPSQIKEE